MCIGRVDKTLSEKNIASETYAQRRVRPSSTSQNKLLTVKVSQHLEKINLKQIKDLATLWFLAYTVGYL